MAAPLPLEVSGTLCDGALLVTPSSVDVTFGAPVVAVDHNAGSSTLPSVDSDNFNGAVTATEYLLGLGHRRIGFLAGRVGPGVGPPAEARLSPRARGGKDRGRSRAHPRGGVPAGIRRGRRTTAARKRRQPDRDLRGDDVSALATISVARSLGLRVPDDLSVIGFDNVPESALSDPPLTTIEQPIQQMGFDATRLLIGLIEGEPVASTHTSLPTKLVARASCAGVEQTR